MRLAHERRLAQAQARAERRAAITSPSAPRVAVDLRWADDRMREGERRSLAQQLALAYAAARRAHPQPVHLHLLGADGLLRQQLEAQMPGMGRWAATVVHGESVREAEAEEEGGGGGGGGEPAATAATAIITFEDDGGDAGSVPIAEFFARRGVPARDLIYLSADSPHELDGDGDGGEEDKEPEEKKDDGGGDDEQQPPAKKQRARQGLDPTKVYVVGGIVDRNRYKGCCLRRAEAAGMSHARLPIERHLAAADAAGGGGNGACGQQQQQRRLAGSRVLTVNQVVELLACRASGDTWAQALAAALPQRKTAEVRGAAAGAADGDGGGGGGSGS
jgi:hypothetical protein